MERKEEGDEISDREEGEEGKRVSELYRLTTKKDTPKPKRLVDFLFLILYLYTTLNMLSLSLSHSHSLSLARTFSHKC